MMRPRIALFFIVVFGTRDKIKAFRATNNLFLSSEQLKQITSIKSQNVKLFATKPSDMFFASSEPAATVESSPSSISSSSTATTPANVESNSQFTEQDCRILGSQELLMLPRQYKDQVFPQMNHVACAVLSATPSLDVLSKAIDEALRVHPLLRCYVKGQGEPIKRIDLFQMVRQGNPDPCTFVADSTKSFESTSVLEVINIDSVNFNNDTLESKLQKSWQASFAANLDDGSWCDVSKGPLWKLEWHKVDNNDKNSPCALLLCFNHAISDQGSVNKLIDQLLQSLADIEATGGISKPFKEQGMPVSVEESVMGSNQQWDQVQTSGLSLDTLKYVAAKAAEGAKDPVILPDKTFSKNPLGALSIISGKTAGGKDDTLDKRSSVVQFRSLSKDRTTALLQACRQNKVTMSNLLTAAVTYAATNVISSSSNSDSSKLRHYKILQSLDMRRFGAQKSEGNTVGCLAGSMDLMHGPLADHSGQTLCQNPTPARLEDFWKLAREGKRQTVDFIESNGPVQAVKVFDFAMSISDLNNLVHLSAQSRDTLGRAYSAGVTNVGVYEMHNGFQHEQDSERSKLCTKHGRYEIRDLYFATTHIRSGALLPVSCMTINGQLKLTFNPISPIIDEEACIKFADSLVEILEVVSGVNKVPVTNKNDGNNLLAKVSNNKLTIAALAFGSAAILSHAQAWLAFFDSVAEMKRNVVDPSQFWAALNFWIFFAVGHPILSPILWISDVLHGSPGPLVGGLVPITFLAGNAAVIWAFLNIKDFRNAINIAALCAFFAYIGAGLDGTAGLGDYNLALDDSYKGQVVKGCPAYNDVRQSSMDGFDLQKYQGKWYEHKFHDWTQFKEVYDTTLDIKLTSDGKGWVDDFAVKGPAPDAAPLSWDKSPVANGAHYFLFGRVDERDPPGILRESGFGVEFPNYIVDVKRDSKGEYTEAIQFQCLERGGVRVFEGINFLSRNPSMSDAEMAAMHARAEKAGMYAYGASPEQMHTVARRPVGAPDLDNNWQAMWRAIGFDKLLELLTTSIEDGGR